MSQGANTMSRPRLENRRRGVRVNSRVPVAIEWQPDAGDRVCEQVHTRIVGPYGCMVVIPHNLPLEQAVHLTNMNSEQTLVAVVVWKGQERPEGWELGIELLNPGMDFWGLEL